MKLQESLQVEEKVEEGQLERWKCEEDSAQFC